MTLTDQDKTRLAQATSNARTNQTPQPSTDSEPLPQKLSEAELNAIADRKRQKLESDEQDRERRERGIAWGNLAQRLGPRYHECRIQDMECYDEKLSAAVKRVEAYALKLTENVAAGNSIVLFGPPGTGKDHMLAALMRLAILGHGMTVDWCNGMDLYGDFRDSMDSKETRESSLIKNLVSPQILAISDPIPPWGDLTQFQAATLFRIIDGRYRQKRPTWITINIERGAEAAQRMGAAVLDRFREHSLQIHCNWKSYREHIQQ